MLSSSAPRLSTWVKLAQVTLTKIHTQVARFIRVIFVILAGNVNPSAHLQKADWIANQGKGFGLAISPSASTTRDLETRLTGIKIFRSSVNAVLVRWLHSPGVVLCFWSVSAWCAWHYGTIHQVSCLPALYWPNGTAPENGTSRLAHQVATCTPCTYSNHSI